MANDPSTSGMKGGGYYDLHSEYQRRVIEQGDDLVREAVRGAQLTPGASSFTIADYGAGTGSTSVSAMQSAASLLRERNANVPIRTVHNDVLTNDFTQLFHNVAGAGGYLGLSGGPIYPTVAGGSFFDQVVPDATVQVGMCSNAAHWCREQRRVRVPQGIYFCDARGDSLDELAGLAAADWNAFLTARAAELAPGGRMLQQGIGRVGGPAEGKVSGGMLLKVMFSVASVLATEGLLDADFLECYTFPVYCRSEQEILAPIGPDGGLVDQLELVSIRTDEVANPYWEKFEQDRDLDAYTKAFMEFIRAWGEPTMMTNLFGPGSLDRPAQEVAAHFFERLEQAIREDPAASRYDAWVVRVLLARS